MSEKFGFLESCKVRDSRGRYTDTEYIIYEEPISRSPRSAYPESENPSLDNPPSENPPVINKEINKKRNNLELTQPSIDYVPSGASREGSEDEGIWREIISENLESDIVREESGCDPGIVDDIVELMVETVCSTSLPADSALQLVLSECSGMAAQVQHDLYGKGGDAG